jgi:hypothetical protein
MGGGVAFGLSQHVETLHEVFEEILGRPIPGEEKLATTVAETRLLVAALREENEMLKDELDFVKGYPVNGC